jgi:hypothetical protein
MIRKRAASRSRPEHEIAGKRQLSSRAAILKIIVDNATDAAK